MSPIGRDEAAGRAARELLDPQYAREPLFDRLQRWFFQFVNDLLDTVAGGGTAGGVLAAIVILLLLVGVAALVVWQVRRAGRRRAAAPGELFDTRRLTAAEHREAAERLAAEGRWTEAIQERLRAIARDLEERALVDGMPGRTAAELAAEAGRALPPFAADLAAAARSFDDVTYGDVRGTPAAYESMSTLDTRLATARPAALGATP
ncbi:MULTISPECIES: DUF4129 domain-containing protein [Nonomuraea]|uniref:DUF4129 domain-containing protein n=1 Tax=Nonomuraea ferruginea TaxID=46174 RepID=A0ABT4SYI3_9ACTN|nr:MULTISPECIES: DUF4129 domain-containing protein [Nonomuraea]MDA0642048.1 DUF4129 domain-containing protein [Nonomuraea ferruginea]TXK36134.1 DUF4129 domain-containing protein [Nonomuraea sp. C10]TXK43428.1 DUF4129 domain-containing protein [Nonomuraea sp. C10]